MIVQPISSYQPTITCSTCGQMADRIFTAPILVACAPDVHYHSPITGEPVQSHAARQEDLLRHGCVPYDPGMKQDELRRRDEQWQAFEEGIDRTVAEDIAAMSGEQRTRLAREVIEGGLTTDAVRGVPEFAQ